MKKKNKMLALMLVLTFVFCMFPLSAMAVETSAVDPEITVSEVYAKAGETVDVTVSVANNPGVNVLRLSVDYDATKLDLVGVKDSALLPGYQGDPNETKFDANPMILYWSNDLEKSNVDKNGVLATLTFKVLDKAAVGDAKVGVTVKDAYGWEMNDVAFDTTAGAVKVYDKPITVSFRMIGDTQHENGVEGHKGYVTWIKTVNYEVKPGSTVYDVFMKAISDYKLDQKGAENDYVTAVKAPAVLGGYWLEVLDNGPSSGWMYKLNGADSTNTMSKQTLVNGDAVLFHYTDDWSAESFDADSAYLNRWLEAKDITPEAYVDQSAADNVEALIAAIGTVTKDSKSAIDAARSAYNALSQSQKALVENYGVLTAAEAKYAELSKAVDVIDPADLPFTDVKADAWYAEEVAYVYSYKLMMGTSDTVFAPDANLTRAQMATILYRIEGSPKVTTANPFNDVEAGSWYTDAVIWAAEKGVVKGVGDGAFEPTTNISREQMACMMYRYAQYKGADMTASKNLTAFSDAAKVSSWAEKEMKWAVAEGLINGMGDGTLTPQGTATRAQAATVLMRFNENIL